MIEGADSDDLAIREYGNEQLTNAKTPPGESEAFGSCYVAVTRSHIAKVRLPLSDFDLHILRRLEEVRACRRARGRWDND